MRRWLAAARRLAGVFTRTRAAREFDAELDSHLQLHIDEHVRAGRHPAEARRLALATLGGRQQARELHRDRQGLPFLDQLSQDVRFGLRLFQRNPGFSLLTITTLTIGLGVNILVFSIGYPIVAAPLPGADADRLVRVFENDNSNVVFGHFVAYRDRNRTLSGLTATRTEGLRSKQARASRSSTKRWPDATGRTKTPSDDGSETGAPIRRSAPGSRSLVSPATASTPPLASSRAPFTIVRSRRCRPLASICSSRPARVIR